MCFQFIAGVRPRPTSPRRRGWRLSARQSNQRRVRSPASGSTALHLTTTLCPSWLRRTAAETSESAMWTVPVGRTFTLRSGRCSHVRPVSARFMTAGQRPPRIRSRSTTCIRQPLAQVGCLIAGSTGSALRAVRLQPSHHAGFPAGSRSTRKRDGLYRSPRAIMTRPSAQSCWPARWPRSWSGAAPVKPSARPMLGAADLA